MNIKLVCTIIIFGMAQSAFAIKDLSTITIDVSVKVVDEENNSLPDSDVTIYFTHTKLQEKKLGTSTKIIKQVYSGEAPIQAQYVAFDVVGVKAEKEGYWPSGIGYDFRQIDRVDDGGGPNGEYQKEFTIILRKKENPRPLYVNRVEWKRMPGTNRPYGFDLEKGDWVVPHGIGTHADFVITVQREIGEHPVFWAKLDFGFTHVEDGLIQIARSNAPYSMLLLGPTAPVKGFESGFSREMGIKPINGKFIPYADPPYNEVIDVEGYWFRVRSVEVDGRQEGRYGKLLGPIEYKTGTQSKPPAVKFTYFLSPDTNRSLEFNGESLVPKANLQGVDKH
jgi:hypothetical protein